MAMLPPTQSPDPAESQEPQGVVLTITDNGDGTYSVAKGDQDDASGAPEQDDGDEAAEQPQVAQSVQEVCALVEQMLGGSQDPKAAWAAEAAQRGLDGRPQQPAMSL